MSKVLDFQSFGENLWRIADVFRDDTLKTTEYLEEFSYFFFLKLWDERDRADLARQLGFTRARISQLLDLLMLAPDLQEQLLDLEAVDGVEPLTERALRVVVKLEGWGAQRVRLRLCADSVGDGRRGLR